MKKINMGLFVAIQMSLLTACSSTDFYSEPEGGLNKDGVTAEVDSMDQLFYVETSVLDNESIDDRSALFTEGGFEGLDVVSLTESGVDLSALDNPTVYFEFDSYKLSEDAKYVVKEHVKLLKNLPNVKVILEGHADEVGDRAYNLKLSEKRALAVKQYAVSEGVNPERIEVVAYGEEKIIYDREDVENYGRNRRSEFVYE